MPTVAVDKANFYRALGREYTTQEFDELCFQFGIELDEDTTDKVNAAAGERPQLKIDIPANRYDLLCHEGISRALLVFLGKMQQPTLKLLPPAKGEMLEIRVTADTKRIRPYVQGAVLRGVTFTPENYASFIDLQDKLHQNLARRRTLVSMGTHDLSTIQAPFTYEALPPEQIKFAPLNKTEEYDGHGIMALYETDSHLRSYLPIIRDSPVYPVIYDANRVVCSLPPIINSNHSRITLDTKDVMIEITAVDETRLEFAMNALVAMFSEYCAEPFTVEPMKITYADGTTKITPDLSPRKTTAHKSYINSCTGLNLTGAQMCELLRRMGHQASLSSSSPAPSSSSMPDADEVLDVSIPCTRPDVLHECDLMEDVAVAYGFDNLPTRFPRTNTVAEPLPINKLSDILRRECAYNGWIEVLPLILCSHDENFAYMNQKDDGQTAIVLENPKTAEFQVVRTSLLPGVFKTIRENRKHALPLRVFEVSDVAFKDTQGKDRERMARNERHVVAVYENMSANFEIVHGLLDRLMRALDVPRIQRGDQKSSKGYYLEESEDTTFFPGRGASIVYRPPPSTVASTGAAEKENASLKDKAASALENVKEALSSALPAVGKAKASMSDVVIGRIGVVHPDVLRKFEIDFPCSALEFDLEVFL
ncbi:putative FRS1-phenylalanyl-tRNA synthetase, beta subunit, cytosolic [Tilletiaria anomala UBC 951]|uniref:Phenylalanine--tRNA ligase beta subunit n=1 Tax=Tilletiaria anomala (strain ATCC 24038 / CBS 436.72 / UBC 951) TaxID=1037660 RepID=A0A066WI74_TILAU|nr:putative FRS1-phenylalanyl-tRNA synthetase, beta subunit, cytosolic [Tilletiaria anomala UBC 951]KDN53536.1 putative FRS1-phenylalanyl-tRNA synthetase, beta subunit, cytosolic [Tilletiaria anomala UBC 951]